DRSAAIERHHLRQPGGLLLVEAARQAKARVVHEDADLEIRQRRRELLRSLERRKIDGNDTGRDAVFLFELEGEGLQPVLAARGEDARESRPRKLAGELRADPRRSTRHD